MDVFGVKVNRAFFAFFICAVMTIGNLLLLYPALLEQKVSMDECNARIVNFTSNYECFERGRPEFNWSVYHGAEAGE